MRFFLDGGKKVWVDDDDSCVQNHVRKDPPLFHLMRGSSSTAFLARCPRTLSHEQRSRLKNHDATPRPLGGSTKPELPLAGGQGTRTEIASHIATQRAKGGVK
jgi:hypothetical protein